MNAKGIRLIQDDIPNLFLDKSRETGSVAIDTEAMGLTWRDRLCLVQLSLGDGEACLVQVASPVNPAPNLKALLTDTTIEKIYHFGRFDIGILYRTFKVVSQPNYCTKIASRFARTYTERHGLKSLCQELLSVDLSKSQQSSDWGTATLTDAQKHYAASDVLYLHTLRKKLNDMLKREDRYELFRAACDFLGTRAVLDCSGFEGDIFAYL